MSDGFAENPTKPENSKAYGGLHIVRMAPGDQSISLDFEYYGSDPRDAIKGEYEIYVEIDDLESGKKIVHAILPKDAFCFQYTDLRNGRDYKVELKMIDKNKGDIRARSPVRFFRSGFVPGVVINYIHPEDYTYNISGRSTCSPSIVRLPDGRLLASHDIYWGNGGRNLSKVFVSKDNGESWKYLSDVSPCFWGKLFVHNDKLYMLGTSTEYGALLLFCSEDGGKTWSDPATLLESGGEDKGGPHKAPMPVVRYNGRLWTAIDYGAWSLGGHASGVASVPEDADIMNGKNWTVTPFLPYDSGWPGTVKGGNPSLLEGNVVITPEGELVNILRYNTKGAIPDYGKAIILKIDKDNPGAPLQFGRVIDFPGNMSKFTVRFDEVSKKYYALVNRVTTKNVSQRNILTLTSSTDLLHWKIERDLLNYEDNRWPEDDTKVGFQYPDWIFDGDDISAVSRTAINGAYNYHNANHLTFHRFRNFR
ncbi:MAG: hypothetical protein GX082_10575 [Clostridiaceae bacterium]|nr:hypothetical protein [Clostridiaceae bacterium]